MKRYACTVAAGLLLALASTGTATATSLPLPGSQAGDQVTSFGDQSVGTQKNEADVTQKQGNVNVNVAPAVAILGDAETTNAQGNGNTADADVDQSNSVEQSQSSTHKQSSDQHATGCCSGQSQTVLQSVDGGDQSVGTQKNEADVDQWQGNGNVNVSPAIAVFGDAKTKNAQGNGNEADATVTQSNETTQSQSSTQKQWASKDGGCCGGQSQAGTQEAAYGEQSVGQQRNDADVTQAQGNGNVNVSPAIAVFGDAKTDNAQGNHNTANADVDQSNSVEQSQSSTHKQSSDQHATGCCSGQSQTVLQSVDGGDQSVDTQKNEADVDQWQGNGNVNVSPAIAVFGDAKTKNAQGNGNEADATVTQSNETTQSQSSTQKQWASKDGGCCVSQSHQGRCCYGESRTATQEAAFGDQRVGEQRNDARVTQKQGNGNVNVSPAIVLGGWKKYDACNSTCKGSWKSYGGDAETTNDQGNWNRAGAQVDQSNSVEQAQTSYQRQSVADRCKGLIYR